MTGLLLLVIAGAWLAVAVLIARAIAARFGSTLSKAAVWLLALPTLLVAPLADELVGSRQFAVLCKQYAVLVVDELNVANRRVMFERRRGDRFAEGTAVRIRVDPYTYKDVDTTRVLVSFHILTAEGGWLSRLIRVSEANAPLLFDRGCSPPDPFSFKKKFNVTLIN